MPAELTRTLPRPVFATPTVVDCPLAVFGAGWASIPQGVKDRAREITTSTFMCDDIDATAAELRVRGVEFLTAVEDRGFGLMTTLRVPGGGEMGLYEPKHPTAYDLSVTRPF